MAIKASAAITLSSIRDLQSCTRYYLLQSSTLSPPAKPTAKPPGGNWVTAEPSYTAGSTNSLYFCDLNAFSDGDYAYSDVSLSSSYEAAKEAYNKAVVAQGSAQDAQDTAEMAQSTAESAQSTADSAQSTADNAQSTADAAQATAASAEETAAKVRAVFTFGLDGLRTRMQGSKWSTMTADDGYYIDHDEIAGHVGSFQREQLIVRGIRVGNMVVRPTDKGGWVWTDD